jgi:hypothetical protein
MKSSVKMRSKSLKVFWSETVSENAEQVAGSAQRRDRGLSDIARNRLESDYFAVIEVTDCVDEETMKVERTVQRLIERADSYTEYVNRDYGIHGIRIIGRSSGPPVDIACSGRSADSAHFTVRIHRDRAR